MKRALAAATLILASASGFVHGDEEPVFASANDADLKEVVPGISKSVLWGDAGEGPYGAFTRFEPGVDAGMHTHTNDVWIVVSRAPTSTRTTPEKSASAPATSSASRVG